MIILEEKFKWHLEAFASELFNFNKWTNYENIQIKMALNIDIISSLVTTLVPTRLQ